jgi:hypothetical protein
VIEVRGDLIAHKEGLVIPLGGRVCSKAGLRFGSRYPRQLAETAVYDFLLKEQLRGVTNLKDFCSLLVFDKWTGNRNGRQAIFFRAKGELHYPMQMMQFFGCTASRPLCEALRV